MNKSRFPNFLLLFIVMIGVANAFANHFYLYWKISWLDMLMHFLGGIWIGLAILWMYYLSGKFKDIPENRRRVSYVYILAITVTAVIGIFWEIFEFNLDFFIVFNEFNGFYDTASDILLALIGAIIVAKYFVHRGYYKKSGNNILND